MKIVWLLTKILSKSLFDTGGVDKKNGKNKKVAKKDRDVIFYVIIIGVCFLFMSVPFAFLAGAIGALLSSVNSEAIVWNMMLPIATITTLVMSIFTIISVFFLSTENSLLLPLPIKPWQILLARFFTTLEMIYLIIGFLLLPICIGFGIGAGLSVDFYFFVVIVLAMIPIIPVAVITLVLTYVMRFVNLAKSKDVFTYVVTFGAIIISLGFSFGLQSGMTSIGEYIDTSNVEAIIAGIQNLNSSLGAVVMQIMPFLIPAVNALSDPNILIRILNLLGFVVLNLGTLALFAWLGGKVYVRAIIGSGENVSRKKKLTSGQFEKETKKSKVFNILVVTEWRTIMRSPTFAMNLVLLVFLMPIILVVSFASSFASMGEEFTLDLLLSELGIAGAIPLNNPITFLVLFGIMMFLGSTNMVSSTAISRMGPSAPLIKYLPIDSLTFVNSKIFWGLILSFVPTVLYLSVPVIMGILAWYDALIVLFPLLATYFFVNYFGFYLDLRKPHLDWTNETYAVKNNMNSFLYMLVCWGAIAILGGFSAIVMALDVPNAGYVLCAFITIGTGLASYAFSQYFNKSAAEVFKTF